MRSSSRRRGDLAGWGVALLCAAVVGFVRPGLAARFHTLRVTSDVYALPSPEQTVVASLGWRSALADLLYGHMLVSYGLHFQEKRRFEFVGNYLDTINALDPTFRQPYRYSDTLLTVQPMAPRQEDYLKAKEVLERGLARRPFDTELWLIAGQYMAYVARPHLEDEALKEVFRKRGAEVLARACELANDNENIPHHCITAAHLFDKVGETEAAVESLKRLLAVNDDPEIQRLALGYLEARLSDRERLRQETRRRAFENQWRGDLPFVSKDAILLLGPAVDVAGCAGLHRHDAPECSVTWKEWAEGLARGGKR